MEQKEWEQRLDRVADKVADTVREGVKYVENTWDRGREIPGPAGPAAPAGGTLSPSGPSTTPAPIKGSPRLGLILVALGIIWLLHSLGILDQPIFPILLIVLGVYFIVRSK